MEWIPEEERDCEVDVSIFPLLNGRQSRSNKEGREGREWRIPMDMRLVLPLVVSWYTIQSIHLMVQRERNHPMVSDEIKKLIGLTILGLTWKKSLSRKHLQRGGVQWETIGVDDERDIWMKRERERWRREGRDGREDYLGHSQSSSGCPISNRNEFFSHPFEYLNFIFCLCFRKSFCYDLPSLCIEFSTKTDLKEGMKGSLLSGRRYLLGTQFPIDSIEREEKSLHSTSKISSTSHSTWMSETLEGRRGEYGTQILHID